jgi:hypothetical protein
MVVLVLGTKYLDFASAGTIAGLWVLLNLLYDGLLRGVRRGPGDGPWFLQPMRVGETRFLLFLLPMSGFWTSLNQIFLTLPAYIRDYAAGGCRRGLERRCANSGPGASSRRSYDRFGRMTPRGGQHRREDDQHAEQGWKRAARRRRIGYGTGSRRGGWRPRSPGRRSHRCRPRRGLRLPQLRGAHAASAGHAMHPAALSQLWRRHDPRVATAA